MHTRTMNIKHSDNSSGESTRSAPRSNDSGNSCLIDRASCDLTASPRLGYVSNAPRAPGSAPHDLVDRRRLTSSAHQSAPEGQRNTDADPRSELPREVIANHAIMSGISPPAPQP